MCGACAPKTDGAVRDDMIAPPRAATTAAAVAVMSTDTSLIATGEEGIFGATFAAQRPQDTHIHTYTCNQEKKKKKKDSSLQICFCLVFCKISDSY